MLKITNSGRGVDILAAVERITDTYFRFYGPYFDKTWQLNDIEQIDGTTGRGSR